VKRTPTFNPQPATPLPADVRLTHAVASSVYLLVLAGALMAGWLWLMRAPIFPIRNIQLQGELLRNSVPSIRATAAPRLAGNFFSVNLADARQAFEAVPWVRRAVVRRVWPDQLAVHLEEHRAVALWQIASDVDGPERLVNHHGEVFDANMGDVEDDNLPALSGPEGSAASMLAMYKKISPLIARMGLTVSRLELSTRGSWRAETDTEAVIELGRGNEEQVLARTERFVQTFAEATSRWGAPLETADLRHADGYAVKLRPVKAELSSAVSIKAADTNNAAAKAADTTNAAAKADDTTKAAAKAAATN
jgi:cell division protein FtsQ